MSLIAHLLDIQAIKLSPTRLFTWASGALSPIYCDNRLSLSYPEVRLAICEAFVAKIKENYPNVEVIAGVATGGIAHGILVADRLGLPFVYVRDKPKGHGRENTIEGHFSNQAKVVVIEDLISTGGSSLKAVASLRESGADVLGLVAIFTYNFEKADLAFAEAKCSYDTLTNFKELIQEIEANASFSDEEVRYMKQWYQKGI
jgi:orotate phosphoribosyltransferase